MNKNIKVYSTHCPRCLVIEQKLENKGIEFELITDIDVMSEKGIMSVPVVEVDGKMMQFKEANDWINNL